MPNAERLAFEQEAHAEIEQFVARHAGYTLDTYQSDARGGTNYVLRGQFREQPVVFKYFVRTYRWAHEYFCLQHFAPTGQVPQILAIVPDQLIVMTRLPSADIETFSVAQRQQASEEIGQGVATLVQWPLPNEANRPTPTSEFEAFAWRSDLGDLMTHCLAQCRRVQAAMPAYQTTFYSESLALFAQQIDWVDRQPRILYHEDIPNLCVQDGHFYGFFDLEMARLGTEAMQLGVAVDLCKPHWIDKPWLDWEWFLHGYERRIGRQLTAADYPPILAMSHFYYHIRLCRWGEWDGDPSQTHHWQFATSMVDYYLSQMKEACYTLKAWVDLDIWFPSLDAR